MIYGTHFFPGEKCLILVDGTKETVEEFVDKSVFWRMPKILEENFFDNKGPLRVISKSGGVRVKLSVPDKFLDSSVPLHYYGKIKLKEIDFIIRAEVSDIDFEYKNLEYHQVEFGPLK